MDRLKNKTYKNYNYTSRYTTVPYYYDVKTGRYVYGIGTAMSKDTPYYTHKISEGDTLDYLSLKYYANPTLWWILAYFNDIIDPFIKLSDHYTQIKIPNMASIKFGADR